MKSSSATLCHGPARKCASMDYIEDLFLTDPTLSFKKAYHKFLFAYNLEKDDISY